MSAMPYRPHLSDDDNRIIREVVPRENEWKSCRALARRILDKAESDRAQLIEHWVGFWKSQSDPDTNEPVLPANTMLAVIEYEVEKHVNSLTATDGRDRLAAAEKIADDEETRLFDGEVGIHPVIEELKDAPLRRLARVCRELATHSDDSTFFMGVRDAARICGQKHPEAGGRCLRALQHKGIIELVEAGDRKARVAATFRYCCDTGTQWTQGHSGHSNTVPC